jgi:O-acetyl-ADP-ribose deacetylase (regulator of RNase III)
MRLELHFGNITEYIADCIVNAARNSLLGGGGVDGAIHKAAGVELKEFCKNLGGCSVGEAKLSPAFNLPSKYIIHTVGPRFLFKSAKEIQDLKNCYSNSLKIANDEKFETIVFSNISTGAYGFPKDLAAKYSFEVISDFLMQNEYPKKVVLCCYEIENLQLYLNIIEENL